jgi:chromosome segregation ATPase
MNQTIAIFMTTLNNFLKKSQKNVLEINQKLKDSKNIIYEQDNQLEEKEEEIKSLKNEINQEKEENKEDDVSIKNLADLKELRENYVNLKIQLEEAKRRKEVVRNHLEENEESYHKLE